VCAVGRGAIALSGRDITDWQRGADSLAARMTDYMIGLMSGRWETTVHVLHMYDITARCDCVDVRQRPMLDQPLGFLVGKNPFAIDRLAATYLSRALTGERRRPHEAALAHADHVAAYAESAYHILRETPMETLRAR
jgi:uncharacterized Fe-S center protein